VPAQTAVEPSAQPASAPMETGRTPFPSDGLGAPLVSAPAATRQPAPANNVPSSVDTRRSESYYETKGTIFGALIEAIDLAQLARLDVDSAREEIRDIVNEIIAIKSIVMSIAEQEDLLDDICNRCSRATTSPTSWSTARARFTSKSRARSRKREFAFATTSSC
jgi:pilus assembly protein CpaF